MKRHIDNRQTKRAVGIMERLCILNYLTIILIFVNTSCKAQSPQQVAFTVGLTTDPVLLDATVVYHKVYTNIGNGYNNKTGVFTVPVEGVYQLSLNLAAGDTLAEYNMWVNDKIKATAFADEPLFGSNNFVILQLKKGDTVQVRNNLRYAVLCTHHNKNYNTISGFLVYPASPSPQQVAFSATVTDGETNVNKKYTVVYDMVYTNIGGGYNPRNGVFTVPKNGVYQLTFSFHPNDLPMDLDLHVNDQVKASVMADVLLFESGNLVILQLKKRDRVQVKCRINQALLKPTAKNAYNTFSGFLIYTDSSPNQVAFTAVLSKTLILTETPVVYDKVYTNIGNAYNSKTGVFTVPKNGVYQLFLSMLPSYGHAKLDMWVNDQVMASVIAFDPVYGSSNLVILELKKGDIVQVKSDLFPAELGHEEDRVFNTFSGFLIYPVK